MSGRKNAWLRARMRAAEPTIEERVVELEAFLKNLERRSRKN